MRKAIIMVGCGFIVFVMSCNAFFSSNASFELRGKVVDDAGLPMPGVHVQCSISYDDSFIPLPILFSGSPASKVIETKTDDEGNFVLRGRGYGMRFSLHREGYSSDRTEDLPRSFMINRRGTSNRFGPFVYRMIKKVPGATKPAGEREYKEIPLE